MEKSMENFTGNKTYLSEMLKYRKKSNWIKLILGSFIGIFVVMIPIPYGETYAPAMTYFRDWSELILEPMKSSLIYLVFILSAILSVWGTLFKPKFITSRPFLNHAFITKPFFLLFRVLGLVMLFMIKLEFGPSQILDPNTGGLMLDIVNLVFIALIAVMAFIPFITDLGLMEIVGVFVRKITKPLFTLPGRSTIDLLTSWLSAAQAGAKVTEQQYLDGYYTDRESAVIATNFSTSSIAFGLIICATAGISTLFPFWYLTCIIGGAIAAIIIPRIYPLSKKPDTYNPEVGKTINEEVPEGIHYWTHSLNMALKRADGATFKESAKKIVQAYLSIVLETLPIVLSLGTVVLIIVEYTSVFNILSYPFGLFLSVLGVPDPFKVAPGTILGFTDMFIPAIFAAKFESVRVKFMLAGLCYTQVIYMTEIGIILMQSKINLNFKDLLLVFIERTVILIPLFWFISYFVA